MTMRLNRSIALAGTFVMSVQVLTLVLTLVLTIVLALVAGINAAAASDCPCKRIGPKSCLPDPACEAREHEALKGFSHGPQGTIRLDLQKSGGNARDDYEVARPSLAPHANQPAPPAVAIPQPPTIANHPAPPENSSAPVGPAPTSAGIGGGLRILETGYSHLSELGEEARGYGLYSYAILPSNSDRASSFLGEVFKEIPAISETGAQPPQLNILYVPLLKDKEGDFTVLLRDAGANRTKVGAEYGRSLYDYKMARALLDHICNPPDKSVRDLCSSDLSRGPYIFTYALPASSMNSVPPPFLLVDLSNINPQAFGELLSAFKEQVKRQDITDQARIRTLRLAILNITLTAADWVNPIQKAIADIVHSSGDDDKK
jgi:hypothetical protein